MNGMGQFSVGMTERFLADQGARFYAMILPAVVAAINHRAGKVRLTVHAGGTDPFLTGWVNWLTTRAGQNRTWNPPEVGEKGLLLSIGSSISTSYFLPAHYHEGAPMPSDNPDVIKEIFLHEKAGVYEYNRRTGQRRWRLHGGGEFRHEVGVLEDDQEYGTSDVIQRKDMIQFRVGHTFLIIKEGSVRTYMVDKDGNEVDFTIDSKGFNGKVNDTGILRLTKNQANFGILQSKPDPDEDSAELPVPLSGLVAGEQMAQLIFNELNVVTVSEGEAGLSNINSKNRLVVTGQGTSVMSDKSQLRVTPQMVDLRTDGSSITLTPQRIVEIAPEFLKQQTKSKGGEFKAGGHYKYVPPMRVKEPRVIVPPELTEQYKPFTPKS